MQRITRFLKRHFSRRQVAALLASLVLLLIVTLILIRAPYLGNLGYLGGFLAMLLGSATVILPAPGLTVVAGLGTTVGSPLLLGLIAGVGAALGEITGYLAGYGGRGVIKQQKYYPAVLRFIERHGFWAIATLAFIPNPLFDIAGLIAGGTRYPFGLFMAATLIGKLAKCVLVAYAGMTTFDWLTG